MVGSVCSAHSQSVTTMRDDDNNELNCCGDSMCTILDDMIDVYLLVLLTKLCLLLMLLPKHHAQMAGQMDGSASQKWKLAETKRRQRATATIKAFQTCHLPRKLPCRNLCTDSLFPAVSAF
jgi:hypothetical protein